MHSARRIAGNQQLDQQFTVHPGDHCLLHSLQKNAGQGQVTGCRRKPARGGTSLSLAWFFRVSHHIFICDRKFEFDCDQCRTNECCGDTFDSASFKLRNNTTNNHYACVYELCLHDFSGHFLGISASDFGAKYTDASSASVLLCTESLFANVFGFYCCMKRKSTMILGGLFDLCFRYFNGI